MQLWVLKLNNFLGEAHHTPQAVPPPPTPTPTWHCVPKWQPRHHFWSLLLPQLSWLFQTLTKTLQDINILPHDKEPKTIQTNYLMSRKKKNCFISFEGTILTG